MTLAGGAQPTEADLTSGGPGTTVRAAPARAARTAASAAPPGGLSPRLWKLVLAAPPIATLALTLLGISSASFWRDEAATLAATRRPFTSLLRMLGNVDAAHGAYYVAMWPLAHLWGTTEFVMRLPSAVAMSLAALGVAAIGARARSWPVGLLSGLVFAVLPLTSRFGQEARSYALVTAFAVLASYLLLRAIEEPGRRWWRAYGLALAAAGLLNLFSLLIVPAHAVTLMAVRRRRHAQGEGAAHMARRWAASAALAGAVAAPVALFTWQQRQQLAWLKKPGLNELYALATMMTGSTASFALIAALCVAGAAVTGTPEARQAITRQHDHASPHGQARPEAGVAAPPPRSLITWLSVPWLILPPVMLLAASELKPVYVYRYVVFCLPALALLTGAGLSALGRFWRIAAIAVIALFALPMQHAVRAPGGHGDDIRAAAQFLRSRARPGDAVIYDRYGMQDWAAAYPYGFTRLHDLGMRQPAAAAGNLSGTEVTAPVLKQRLKSAARVWLIEVYHNRPDPALIGPPRFRLTGTWLISDIVLRLYERAGAHQPPGRPHRVIPVRLEASAAMATFRAAQRLPAARG